MRKLINPYPVHKTVDRVLDNMGDEFSHDAIHDLPGAEEDEADMLEGDACDSEEEAAVAEDKEAADDEEEDACSDGSYVIEDEEMCDGLETAVADEKPSEAIVALSGAQA